MESNKHFYKKVFNLGNLTEYYLKFNSFPDVSDIVKRVVIEKYGNI